MITIIDYKIGNKGSIQNMLKKIGVNSIITDKKVDVENATKLILPGVGHFGEGMKQLHNSGLIPSIEKQIFENNIPILGICLGMQLMTKRSDESDIAGLGWIDAETLLFKSNSPEFKVPHMGWNYVETKKNNALLNNDIKNRFYFVHSYYIKCNNENDITGTTNYMHDFVSYFNHENIFGVQFHPEKSHKFGMNILNNFAHL